MSDNSISNKNCDGLRNRRPVAAALSDNETTSPSDPSVAAKPHDHASAAASHSVLHPSNSNKKGHLAVLKWILHLVAIACFVTGIIMRTNRLHNGEECDMTYSIRIFLKVETPRDEEAMNPATSQYGLYKYVEQRDPRYNQLRLTVQHQKLQIQKRPLARDEHCTRSSDTIVVYVPGHWGSYDQARSLGAHGIGFTRKRETSYWKTQQKLIAAVSGNNTADASGVENFVYDVYSVDFGEQGGGLHGQFLQHQADYLANVLQQLTEDCGGKKNLIVVAHSMGGYVARQVLLEHPELPVHNLITLATPHLNPLYAFDKSVSDFHRKLSTIDPSSKNERPLMLSISGGLRDEMIDPAVCKVPPPNDILSSKTTSIFGSSQAFSEEAFKNEIPHSWSIQATTLVQKAENKHNLRLFGMDHRAIVWCHQLLKEVRQVLWVLVAFSESPVSERLDQAQKSIGVERLKYDSYLKEMKKEMDKEFGPVVTICMESSMIYNLPHLLALYASQVGLRCARFTNANRLSSMLPVWASILLGWTFRRDLSWLTTLILALVANSFNLLVLHLMPSGFLLRKRRQNLPLQTLRSVLLKTLVFIFAAMVIGLILYCNRAGLGIKKLLAHNSFGLFTSTLYVYAFATIYANLIVWMGFIENHRAKVNEEKNKNSNSKKTEVDETFEMQLIVFVMMTAPFLVAGSIVLMVWEQKARMGSWETMLSLLIPVGTLASIRLYQIQTNARKNLAGGAMAGDRLGIRSILIYLLLFAFVCYFEPGLFSPGTGYLVPDLAIKLVWVGVIQSLFS